MTGKPGVLQSMGLPRVRHDLATEQKQQCTLKLFSVNNISDEKILSISTKM